MFVKPGLDPVTGELLKVRVPPTMRFLPDEGGSVPDDDYWHRRLRDGDVVLAQSQEAAA